MYLSNNSILSAFDIDSTEFLFTKEIKLYENNNKSPFGKVTLDNGKYRLTVGDLSLFDQCNLYYNEL